MFSNKGDSLVNYLFRFPLPHKTTLVIMPCFHVVHVRWSPEPQICVCAGGTLDMFSPARSSSKSRGRAEGTLRRIPVPAFS